MISGFTFKFLTLCILLKLTISQSVVVNEKAVEPSLMMIIQDILNDPEFLTLSLEQQLQVIQAIYDFLLKHLKRSNL
jgi:hypothetical protein